MTPIPARALRRIAMLLALVALAAPPCVAADAATETATDNNGVERPHSTSPTEESITLPPVEMRLIQEGRSLPIDLQTVVRLAEANNLDILAARARLAEVSGHKNEALGELVPEITGSFSAQRIDGMIQASFGELGRRSFSTLVPAVGVRLRLNPAEALFDALAAHRELDAATSDAAQTRQDVLARAAGQYFGLLARQAQVRIAEQALDASRELARIGRDRASVGAGLQVDVLRAEARQAADEVQLAQARKLLRRASLELALTLKLDPTVTLFPAETVVRQRTLIEPALSLDALIARALAARPDIAAQERRLSAAAHDKSASLAQALGPTVYGSFEESAIGRSTGNLDNRQIYGGFLGLTLSPSSIGRVQAAEARVEQARLANERLEQRIAAEVIAARDEALTAQEQIDAAVRGLSAAEAALGLSRVRFKSGLGIGLEVLDAEAALSESRTNVVTAIVAYDASQVGLLRAVGGISASSVLATDEHADEYLP